jgi:hypothetical protein
MNPAVRDFAFIASASDQLRLQGNCVLDAAALLESLTSRASAAERPAFQELAKCDLALHHSAAFIQHVRQEQARANAVVAAAETAHEQNVALRNEVYQACVRQVARQSLHAHASVHGSPAVNMSGEWPPCTASAASAAAASQTLSETHSEMGAGQASQIAFLPAAAASSRSAAAASHPSAPIPAIHAQKSRGVPKSGEHWIVVGVWLASREFPALPFFLPLVDAKTGLRVKRDVPYRSIIAILSPQFHQFHRDRIPLNVRVVQRQDISGRLVGEIRYICTDIAVSYKMGDSGFQWISKQ